MDPYVVDVEKAIASSTGKVKLGVYAVSVRRSGVMAEITAESRYTTRDWDQIVSEYLIQVGRPKGVVYCPDAKNVCGVKLEFVTSSETPRTKQEPE